MKYDLERLRKSTLIKLVFMSISIAIPIILVFVMAPIARHYFAKQVTISIHVMQALVIVCAEAYIIVKVVMYGVLLGNKNHAEKVLIKKNDEREIFIRQKSSEFTIKMVIFLLLIGVLVSGFINTIVFTTLLIVSAVILLTALITSIYYGKKY